MTTTPTAPGWYDDPAGRRRWWDGQHWGAYAPWDQGSAPRVVRSASSAVRLDRRYLLDPTPPVARTARAFDRPPVRHASVAYALLVLLGPLGAHRFYVGRNGSARTMLALTVTALALLLAPLDGLPLLDQLDASVPLPYVGCGVLAVIGLWWLLDVFQTAKLVRRANRESLLPTGPRTYYRGWPAA